MHKSLTQLEPHNPSHSQKHYSADKFKTLVPLPLISTSQKSNEQSFHTGEIKNNWKYFSSKAKHVFLLLKEP